MLSTKKKNERVSIKLFNLIFQIILPALLVPKCNRHSLRPTTKNNFCRTGCRAVCTRFVPNQRMCTRSGCAHVFSATPNWTIDWIGRGGRLWPSLRSNCGHVRSRRLWFRQNCQRPTFCICRLVAECIHNMRWFLLPIEWWFLGQKTIYSEITLNSNL